jgi:predicted DCC family thiol-disulfide oxidoreductase YuxK
MTIGRLSISKNARILPTSRASACAVVKTRKDRQFLLMANSELTVWYDGGCPLCLREISVMRRLDRRGAISFIDVTSENSFCPISPAELLARFHAQENGLMLSGAAAFAAMWRAIPVLRPLGLAARNRLVLAGLERIYIVFLKHRPRLQRFVTWLETRSA